VRANPDHCDISPKIGVVISRGVVKRGAKDTVAGEERLLDGWDEGVAVAGCWWRIERDQDDGIGVAGVEWRRGEIGWDGGW